MKNSIYFLFTLVFLFVSCSQEEEMVDTTLTLTSEADSALKKAKTGKVNVSHYDADTDTWKTLNINGNALEAHLNHGDVSLVDTDGDGYVKAVNECVPGGDCDDTNADINPGMDEIPYNGFDDDCDPATLDDDLDEDGFLNADDCDDTNPEINPEMIEICGNEFDEDCDGIVEDCVNNEWPNFYVPDKYFEQALIDLGIDSDGIINHSVNFYDVQGVESLDVSSRGIYNLTGLDNFYNLTNLDCSNNNISNFPFTLWTTPSLRTFDISGNKISTLTLNEYSKLNYIDVSANPNLTFLNARVAPHWPTVMLDASNNPNLKTLLCDGSGLKGIDISQTTSLEDLKLGNNELTSINLSTNVNLKNLDLNFNKFTNLNLSYNNNLSSLSVIFNSNLTSLNVRNGNNSVLTNFLAFDNPLLTCIQVDNASWSVSNWTGSIDSWAIFSDDCGY